MAQSTEAHRDLIYKLLGLLLIVLQGFGIYIQNNMESHLSRLDGQLQQAYDATLILGQETATLKKQQELLQAELKEIRLSVQDTRELVLKSSQ